MAKGEVSLASDNYNQIVKTYDERDIGNNNVALDPADFTSKLHLTECTGKQLDGSKMAKNDENVQTAINGDDKSKKTVSGQDCDGEKITDSNQQDANHIGAVANASDRHKKMGSASSDLAKKKNTDEIKDSKSKVDSDESTSSSDVSIVQVNDKDGEENKASSDEGLKDEKVKDEDVDNNSSQSPASKTKLEEATCVSKSKEKDESTSKGDDHPETKSSTHNGEEINTSGDSNVSTETTDPHSYQAYSDNNSEVSGQFISNQA